MPINNDLKEVGGIEEPRRNEQTPESKKQSNSDAEETPSPAAGPADA